MRSLSTRHARPGRVLLPSIATLLLIGATPAMAQVSLTAFDAPYTQSFDTLPASGSATWTQNGTIAGWYALRTGTGTTVVADVGSSNAGNLYSFGASGSSDRALGSLGSGNAAAGNFFHGVRLRNNTGATITSLDVSYFGEQWRNSAAVAQTATFSYVIGAPAVTGSLAEFQAAGTAVAALDFTSPTTGGTAGPLNGNAAPARVARTATIANLSIPNGSEIMLRWADPDHAGSDHGLAIDDVSITPRGANPVPMLSIDDVENHEGTGTNGTFTFTVSLSAPAPAGGVTFDITTADGTAIAPADYIAKSLTAQTIPAGASSYTFDVEVIADSTPEPDETFSVNVGNVTGANVADGTGLATLFNDDGGAQISIDDVSANEGNSGTTTFSFLVTLSEPASAGGVSFDIATADGTALAPSDYTARALTGQTIAAGADSFVFDVLVNGDTATEPDETFTVTLANVQGAFLGDTIATGTIVNDDAPPLDRIHQVQGSGETSPMVGATVTVEGVVTGSYQTAGKLSGFFLQEEDTDVDSDPATSEGIFIYCQGCPVSVAEGNRVRVNGVVSEFFGATQITATTAPGVIVTSSANHLAEITPSLITLPIAGDVNAFHEARESMLVRYADPLLVSEYFQLARFGTVTLFQGERPRQFTADNAPNAAGYQAHLAELARRRVLLDDEDNGDNGVLNAPDGQQAIHLPQANGGFGVGTQGTDFFRGGDRVENLTGVLHWSFSGLTGTDAWRIRPVKATPATFTVANPRPAGPPQVAGAIRAAGVNVLNYFSTIDTTSSNSSGNCGPSANQDCRGADSNAELVRQRERTARVLCDLDADVVGLSEIENHATGAALNDLLGAVNARCGGTQPYTLVGNGNAIGSDAIRVALIYRAGVLAPFGAPLYDTNAIHNRPLNAQVFDVIEPGNPALGERFSVVAAHFKSKSCSGAGGADADAGDGEACFGDRRNQQAQRLAAWVGSTVVPAAGGDTDVLLVGDYNAYSSEAPIATLGSAGFSDLMTDLLDTDEGYSYLFDGQLGHLDYVFASSTLLEQVADVAPWHINADEVPVFDYNDEIRDTGEAAFEKKPNGAALTPPRSLWQPNSPFRASDHDPVLVGLFGVGNIANVGIAATATPDPVTAGSTLVYTVTVDNDGPDVAETVTWTTTLSAATDFSALSAPAGWTCSTPAVGSTGVVSCVAAAMSTGESAFSLTVIVDAGTAGGSTLAFAAGVSSDGADTNTANNSTSLTTGVIAAPRGELAIDPDMLDFADVAVGSTSSTLSATLSNIGNAALVIDSVTAALAPFEAAAGSCGAAPITIAAGDSCTLGYQFVPSEEGVRVQTLTLVTDVPGESMLALTGTGFTAEGPQADLAISIDDGRQVVAAGGTLAYVITVTNAGPDATEARIDNVLPVGTGSGTWTCSGTGMAVCGNGSGDTLVDIASLAAGESVTYVYSVVVALDAGDTTLVSTATVTALDDVTDPDTSNNTASDTTLVSDPIFADGFETIETQ